MKPFVVAVDCDGMLFAFPKFFVAFFAAMQGQGHKVGIMTARTSDQKEQIEKTMEEIGIKPDFVVCKPDDFESDNGVYKALACNEMGVDLLFDDFQASDPTMLASFFQINQTTLPFTSWAYDPDELEKDN